MNPLLEIKNLKIIHRKYKKTLIDNINFGLNDSEILGIIGESGSGKTLTCRSVLNLLDRKAFDVSGEILFENQNLLSLSDKSLNAVRGKKIALIMQNPMSAFDPMSKIGKQILETLKLHQNASKKHLMASIEENLTKFGLSETERILNSFPSQLSGGMLQRLMVILALMLSPEIIIADETTTALDIKTQSIVLEQFIKIKESGISLIVITHDFRVIAKLADNVIVMKDGIIIEKGTVFEIFNSPKTDYTKNLLQASILKGGGI